MSDQPLPRSEMILYQTEDGRTRIQCRLDDETLWLTQAQIAELFETTPQNVTLHLKGIFAEGEVSEVATCKDYLQVSADEARTKAELEYARYRALLDAQPRAVDADFEKAAQQVQRLPQQKPPKP